MQSSCWRPGTQLTLDTDASFEHGLLVDAGSLALDGHPVPKDHLAYLPVGHTSVTLAAGSDGARVLLIGGEPLGEKIVMWWNFVGRSHEEIVAYRAQWQAEIGAERRRRQAGCRLRRGTMELRFGTFPPGRASRPPGPGPAECPHPAAWLNRPLNPAALKPLPIEGDHD